MGPAPRERHNAKSRQSTAGSRKKGKRKRQDVTEIGDANALIHVPKTNEERELTRREKLKQELLAEGDNKWNNKKKKRLEKYIDKKLKKEERVQILEKLSQSQAQITNTLHLQSSSTLGTGRASTHRERLDKLEDIEVRKALDGRAGKRKRNDEYAVTNVDEDDEDDTELFPGHTSPPEVETVAEAKITDVVHPESSAQPTASTSAAVGSALQRNPDGTVVAPKIRPKRQKTKSTFCSWEKSKAIAEEDSETSFDSSDSENDTSDEGGEEQHLPEELEAGSSDEDASEEDTAPSPPKRSLGFKDWARKQLSAAKGYVTADQQSASLAPMEPRPPPNKKRKLDKDSGPMEMRGPLGEDLALPDTSFAQQLKMPSENSTITKPKSVSVTRPPDVEEARILLPIVSEEQPIMEAILLNPVVIICGETGSGKTTQVPQFLYEAGFGTPDSENPGMIGITQPRRVAAMSMASRVAHELSLTSSRVSYQIRYDATVSPSTSIKFMTDGVLLRELATDFLLNKYSVIIIDEAHERSMNTDILIGVLSRVLKLREQLWKEGKEGAKPLRLIVMSATLRVSDFAENKTLFPKSPPVINVAARQHPVTVHFNRRTVADYVTEAIKKTTKIHTRLPPGGILIFLTGQNEIQGVCRKLESRFGQKALQEKRKRRGALQAKLQNPMDLEDSQNVRTIGPALADVEAEDLDLGNSSKIDEDLAIDVDTADMEEDPEALDSDEEDELGEELGVEFDDNDVPMHVVPLYSLLASDKQMKVFEPPPSGTRLVVVSTNVAETSLTIPGIRYVVDCGRAKQRRYDIASGIQSFQVDWISKASAAQRSGRAGRTGPGHCYRLYSSALFEHYFDSFSQPEILQMPIEGVVLQMKTMHIDAVINFPFPTPPERQALQKAEKILTHLAALKNGEVTDLGRAMSLFPLSPRFARMLAGSQQHQCLPYVIAIVSALSVGDPFLHDEGLAMNENGGDDGDDDNDLGHLKSETVKAKEALRLRRKAFFQSQQTHSSLGKGTSDMFRVLSVVGAYEYAGGGLKFCGEHFVRPKAMEEIHKLRAQISNIVQVNFPGVKAGFEPNLRLPNNVQIKVLRQLLTAGFIDQVAVRKDRVEKVSSGTQYASSKGVPYKAIGISGDVFIHPSSVLASKSPPEYVVFNEVVRTSRVWIKGVTVVNPAWLASLGKGSLCTFSKPVKNNVGNMMVIPRFGPEAWELPASQSRADIVVPHSVELRQSC
ncbi:P-loop containing nucleoside triphosphate hydrolase protein [Desarmillaria tabescens]|uniref:RNA helicase n=1 Tax=Armillaria tabescens TaxID=1929756 RepID=A0AA39NF75_ARMTA|nr:P-loop containing nucleoside triphosphate hydrolase protein [Desarmillaria tabescens]KAK0464536.1 P-loop containing nucleoside triphosphate hydrolase protein [Desarmillaria tabescens]